MLRQDHFQYESTQLKTNSSSFSEKQDCQDNLTVLILLIAQRERKPKKGTFKSVGTKELTKTNKQKASQNRASPSDNCLFQGFINAYRYKTQILLRNTNQKPLVRAAGHFSVSSNHTLGRFKNKLSACCFLITPGFF